jgi:Trehalose utilisation
MNKNESPAIISRRRLMAAAGAVATGLSSSMIAAQQPPQKAAQDAVPAYAVPVPGPPGQVPKFKKTDVWVQLTTGGQSYPASFQAMFLDPVFLGINVWPIDQPASFDALVPGGGNPPSRPRQQPAVASGARTALGGGTERLEPVDYPWEPSGGRPHPGYDVLILNDQINWELAQRTSIEKALAAGRGVVVLHYALGDNQDWAWWYQEVTGGLLALSDLPDMKKSTISAPTKLDVRLAGKHPILRNIEPFSLSDEQAFKGMWQSPKIKPLLQTDSPGSDTTVAWVGVNPKVVCIQMGASRDTHNNAMYRMLLRNSILWAAGRLV